MPRLNQAGARLLYSNDGLLYNNWSLYLCNTVWNLEI